MSRGAMRKIQRGIMPRAATVETKVMVMERLMSPLSSNVQKLDPVPPGHVPSTKRPSLSLECSGAYSKLSRMETKLQNI